MLSAAEWETFTPTINELIKWEKFLLSNPCTIVHVSWVPKQLCLLIYEVFCMFVCFHIKIFPQVRLFPF